MSVQWSTKNKYEELVDMKNEMLKERFSREDISKVDIKDLGVMYLATLASLIEYKKKEDKTLKVRDGIYVFTTCSNKEKGGCKHFGINGMEALQYFIKKTAECAGEERMYCALGMDYSLTHMYDNSLSSGAEDLIICGDDYPNRSDLDD